MSDKQVVTFYDSYVEMTVNGISKLLSINDFKSIFDRLMNAETAVEPLILPRNALMFSKNANIITLNTYWPEIETELIYKGRETSGTRKFKVTLPNIIIYFQLKVNSVNTFSVTTCRYFCTPLTLGKLQLGQKIKGFITTYNRKDEIYPLALPNMYSNGSACYGSNSMPGGLKDDLRALDWYYLFLKETPFNSDLAVPFVERSLASSLEFLKYLENNPYPFDKLRI